MTTALPAPRPIDALELSPDLDGRYGTNRANGRMQVAADTDLDALRAWLARFADTKTTFDNYRKEAERLLLWSVLQMGKPLSSLTHEDLLVYQHFLADPQPSARWTADGGRKHPRNDLRWRPFYGPLSATSQRQAMVILNVMFAWLVQAGYLAGNPLSLSRQRARRARPRIVRYLSPELWLEVKTYIQGMPVQTAREREHHARVRWLFTLLYLGGLRITEVGTNTMGQFFRRADENGTDRWWLEVMGKGGKERLVPATAEMMVELGTYRQARGLPRLPSPGEDTPLVLPVGQSLKPLTRAALHRIVKDVFGGAAQSLRAGGEEHAQRAERLEQASAHWLRHSAGSHMADQQLDLRLVRDNLGHASLTTTSQYLHVDDDRRHRETDEKHRIGW
ncbi:tyrosine-type recombinase/integrase [Paraburkholderia sp. BCC1876]|uniref:tyrosine-type recombinase/integrase n=1 Tax=Paraburkholderia sp. BCC1876 TaxID=2676303 RepID=UPI0015915897|nr:tyrosine-type recombinase/integrase [Paraburkholderia sp. BCC1876]